MHANEAEIKQKIEITSDKNNDYNITQTSQYTVYIAQLNVFIDTVALMQHYKDVPLQNGSD